MAGLKNLDRLVNVFDDVIQGDYIEKFGIAVEKFDTTHMNGQSQFCGIRSCLGIWVQSDHFPPTSAGEAKK